MLHNRKAVCITGGGFSNKGAEAMLMTVADALRRRLADVQLYARVRSRDMRRAYAENLVPIKSDSAESVQSKLGSRIRTLRSYCRCPVFVDVGGYQFGDPWGPAVAKRRARSLRHHKWFGNQVYFMPQAWGPFSNSEISGAVQVILEAATLAYVRDRTSLEAVESIVGKNHPKVRFAHDIAWNFRGADLSVGARLIEDAGLSLKDGALTVCVTPNLRVYEKFEDAGHDNQYIKILRDIIHHLCRTHRARVVLVGHQLYDDNSVNKDDRTLCNYILSLLTPSLQVIHLDKVLSAAEVKSVIGNCNLLLSSRYHALIAALSQGIPVATIGWSHKYDELMAEVGLSSNVLSLPKTTEQVLQEIDSVVAQMAHAREVIKSTVPVIKHSSQEALNEVISMVEQRFQA